MRNHVTVNGIELAFDERGRGSRPLLLVHGFTGSADDFREHIDALASYGKTIAIDQRGHGDSTNTGDASSYTLEQLVDDLRAFLGACSIATCDLLGHSMGGMVALRVVLAAPRRIASLILMDTAAHGIEGISRSAFAAGGALGRDAGMAQLAAVLRARAEDDPQRPAASRRCETAMGSDVFWGRIRQKMTAMDPEAFASLGGALVEQESVLPRLGEISCPTLIIVGEEDRPFLGPADELCSGIPTAQRVTIKDAAHSPQLENPAAWFAAIRDHLARVRSE